MKANGENKGRIPIRKRAADNINVKKATVFSIVINLLQCALVLLIALEVCIGDYKASDALLMRIVVVVAAGVVIWGAVVDVRDAYSTRQVLSQVDDMDDTIENMEQFNNTLRSQRHDFLNHLQVVYSLIEMEEYEEANKYIEKIYGAINSVNSNIKTAIAPVNALLQVKIPQCQKMGINAKAVILSSYKDLTVPGWEMCKVLSNLIDNAADALEETEEKGETEGMEKREKKLTVTLTENVKNYKFSVMDNGKPIDEKMIKSIFSPGITTKAEGHGMGLYIVRKTLEKYGGQISVLSDEEKTEFVGYVPKSNETEDNAAKEK